MTINDPLLYYNHSNAKGELVLLNENNGEIAVSDFAIFGIPLRMSEVK